MLEKISLNHPIFKSEKFKKDEISFNLIPYFIKNKDKFPDIKCYSDEQNTLLLNTDKNHPIIVWSDDDFNEYESLYDFLNQTFFENTPFQIMTKKSLYDFFKKRDWILNDTETTIAGVYRCFKLKNIQKNGYLDCVNPSEHEYIAKMLQDFNLEAQPNEKHPFSYYMDEAKKFILNPQTHKVWKDENNQITSIGRIELVENYGRIGRIYTLPEQRGKSYAKMLVHELASITSQKGLTPVLYTNYKYEPSNRCYQAIGFELLNTIFIYDIKKK